MKPNQPTVWIPLSGQTLFTRQAARVLEPEDVAAALRRHRQQDWGDLSVADRAENELSLKEGFRLFSVYSDRAKNRFYIITEADRSVTTVLLPEDY